MKKLPFLLLLVLFTGPLTAQTTLQVVTRSLDESWPYAPGMEVNIEGDKAEIVVQAWDRKEVDVKVDLIAKHPERPAAERDLMKMVFTAKQEGNNIYVRNYIDDKEGKPEAALSAVYTIKVPREALMYVKNNFGETFISNLTRSVEVNSRFSKVGLENLEGTIQVETRYGDLNGENLNGTVSINARRSDVTLREIRGTFDIYSQFGVVKLFTDASLLQQNLLSLNIEADKSDVFFFDPDPTAYGYTLTAHYGNIIFPNELKMNWLENTDKTKRAIFRPGETGGNLSVKLTFGDFTVRKP